VCLSNTHLIPFDWDDAKNAKLRAERRIGFEDVVFHIERGDLLDKNGDVGFWSGHAIARGFYQTW
jgi:hypothetical protein